MKWISLTLATASVVALASPTHAAQPAPDAATLGEIVVTARRRAESLQDVPQVVNAVTADTLQKLNIKDFRDVQAVVPGLSLANNSQGFNANAAMRGVSFNAASGAQPTVAFYLNDAPVQPGFLFQAMFDVGQIEVLRGPQGTSRGVSAPSGAMTVTTRKPDLSAFGGFADVTVTDLQGRNATGAINIPIIQDVLGLRVAGLIDQNDVNGVRSIYSRMRPRAATNAVRVSLSFEPNDALNANLSYMKLNKALEIFIGASGPGFPGVTPLIDRKDRVGVQDVPTETHSHYDIVVGQVDSRVFGQHLTYIGSFALQKFRVRDDQDWGQNLPGVPYTVTNFARQEFTSHELRIASDPSPDRLFDYTVGGYYSWQATGGGTSQVAAYQSGAFGRGATPDLAAFDPRFQIPLFVATPIRAQEYSVFGTVNFHLGKKTELTTGVRHIWSQISNRATVQLRNGLIALPIPCAAARLLPGPEAGTCTIPVGGTIVTSLLEAHYSDTNTTYNVQLSHRFTSDLMAYASVGTSVRPGYPSLGVFNASNDPVLADLIVHPTEKARAFEIGFKWSFLEGRGRLNAAIFRQKFKNLPTYVLGVPYVSNNGTSISVTNFNFTGNPDATVDGFDIDAAFQITPQWSISGQVAYADGRVTGGGLPCNDSNFDGRPDNGLVTSVSQFPPGKAIAICPGGSVSRLPLWNASFQSEYVHPVNDDIDAYVRGLLTYYPENNRVTPGFTVDNYSLLNLYAGVRANDGGWEVGLFARNALNTEKVTSVSAQQMNNVNSALSSFPTLRHNSGYFETAMTPRREFGLNVRYAWGSR